MWVEVCRDNWTSNENTCFEGWIGRKGMAWNEARHETCAFFFLLGGLQQGFKAARSRDGSYKPQEKPGQEKAAAGGDMYPLPFQAMDPQQCSPLMV